MQKVISSKVHNKLLKSIYDKTKQEKNIQKSVYRLRHLNIEEAKALYIRKKKQDNFYKENEAKAWKLALIAKTKKKKKQHKKQF